MSTVSTNDLETAWFLDTQPIPGQVPRAELTIAELTIIEGRVEIDLSLAVNGTAKTGRINGALVLYGASALGEPWQELATRRLDLDPETFINGHRTETFARNPAILFFRACLIP